MIEVLFMAIGVFLMHWASNINAYGVLSEDKKTRIRAHVVAFVILALGVGSLAVAFS